MGLFELVVTICQAVSGETVCLPPIKASEPVSREYCLKEGKYFKRTFEAQNATRTITFTCERVSA